MLSSSISRSGQQMNVQLSLDETYADIAPVRKEGSVSAFMYGPALFSPSHRFSASFMPRERERDQRRERREASVCECVSGEREREREREPEVNCRWGAEEGRTKTTIH